MGMSVARERSGDGAAFGGFPPETFSFLADLAMHNNKDWFDRHRADYRVYFVEPALALARVLGEALQNKVPGIVIDPRINGNLRRINRDIRFSRDKRPYHTHIQLLFWEGATPKAGGSGFSLWLEADGMYVGAGILKFQKPMLDAYRRQVAEKGPGAKLARLTAKLAGEGWELGGEHYKRVPAGFDPAHPRAALLRHDGLTAGKRLPLPASVHGAGFKGDCLRAFTPLLPLHRWLHACAGIGAGAVTANGSSP